MSIKVIPSPTNRTVAVQIKNLINYSRNGIRKGFYYLGKDLTRESQRLIKEPPKTGRIYRLKKGSRIVRHQASAPGEAPANFTGTLRKSVDFIVQGSDRMEFGVREYFPDRKGQPKGVKYARSLELGNPKSHILPRPFLKPSIVKNKANAVEHFNREIKKALMRGEL